MIKRQLLGFALHWLFSSAGMWLCFRFLFGGQGDDAQDKDWAFYILAGLVFSLINITIRPLATIFALPLSLWTLGLSTILVNSAMVALTLWFVRVSQPPIYDLVLSSLAMSLINGLVNFLILPYNKR